MPVSCWYWPNTAVWKKKQNKDRYCMTGKQHLIWGYTIYSGMSVPILRFYTVHHVVLKLTCILWGSKHLCIRIGMWWLLKYFSKSIDKSFRPACQSAYPCKQCRTRLDGSSDSTLFVIWFWICKLHPDLQQYICPESKIEESTSRVSHWSGGPEDWHFPVVTKNQWSILFLTFHKVSVASSPISHT